MRAAAVTIAAAGFIAILVATLPYGIGLSPDSTAYVGGARNIIAGHGFSMPPGNEPITHLAPLYSGLLAVLGKFGPEPMAGARWLAATLLAVSLLTLFALAKDPVAAPRGPDWVAVAVPWLAVTARPVWETHLMAWTEPLFITLCLAGIGAMSRYLRTRSRAALSLSALLVGLSIVTRYAGLSICGAFGLAVLLLGRQSLSRRIADAAIFGTVCLSPFAIVAARNLLVSGAATNRTAAFHPITGANLREALTTVATWVMVPDYAGSLLKLAVVGLVGAVLCAGALLWRRSSAGCLGAPGASAATSVSAICAVVYPAFLVVSISFADANTPLDQRLLSPFFVFLLLPAAEGLRSWDRLAGGRNGRRWAIVAAVAVFGILNLRQSVPLFAASRSEGIGFNSRRWQSSETVRAVRELPAGAVVYSNSPDAIYFHTGRGARKIPKPFSRVTRTANPAYGEELREMRQAIDSGGCVAWFETASPAGGADESGPVKELGLTVRQSLADGKIYGR